MSLSHEPEYDDQLLVQYLLGLLEDEDADQLDEMSIVDDEVASRLLVVEQDLIDAFVSGALEGETLERFDSYYLSSPRRRQKVRFAGSLLRAVNGAAAGADGSLMREARPAPAADLDTPSSPASQPQFWIALPSMPARSTLLGDLHPVRRVGSRPNGTRRLSSKAPSLAAGAQNLFDVFADRAHTRYHVPVS